MGAEGPIGQACLTHLAAIRTIVTDRARQAGLRDVENFTFAFNLLMKGSIVCAAEGDTAAARRARPIGAWLIEQHRSAARAPQPARRWPRLQGPRPRRCTR
ncbi:hypothetical protein BH09ACT8_BH09ACT8_58660 [soil metagenome]